ncbi:MAG: antidote-toxin recognition MazE family protein [Bradyrhizobium sp.]|uniref:AbrB/MazE/SpoVT family DNA-binding domain-containing protein n=1 Tax=Sphingomonas bacterium TaxID=1895847 RepID=UPI00260634BC|nr:AbrB/MazE/SpoVT family DNA-binding domain-containing protein [Sphingomonas bacterium]MDB5584589.1 antidote-toxin recognition MazE family protein [Bradyrhizobium sp.]MDB5711101.1 antidote-toxin recognition MazE family protein [Sphingomonas bacterium]
MNMPEKIEGGTMTSKGQVLIPKAIRDAVGLVPGKPVTVRLNENGEAVVAPVGMGPEDGLERRRRMREGLLSIAGKYATGRTTDEIMRELRGDYEP